MNDVSSLAATSQRMDREMEELKRRLSSLEFQQQQQQQTTTRRSTRPPPSGEEGEADSLVVQKPDDDTRTIEGEGSDDGRAVQQGAGAREAQAYEDAAAGSAPPIERIKFSSPRNADEGSGGARPPPSSFLLASQIQVDDGSSDTSSARSDSLTFEGWARCFFQARSARSATQIKCGATSSSSQDTYLHVSMSSSSNTLRISNTDDQSKPPLVDPPIQLRYFYAARVPGSNSGAALFLRNDSRRLRKYIFRFEFLNTTVRQPPERYLKFVRSGKAAKKSMKSMNKMKEALRGASPGGPGADDVRDERLRDNKKRAQDAFAVHLQTLDGLLSECDGTADRFVDAVNSRNETEADVLLQERGASDLLGGGVDRRGIKRSKPPPPYWGAGFGRQTARDEDGSDLDDDESDSDGYSDDEEDELYNEDDNDDETFKDRVQVSMEQTFETVLNHIVK